MEAVYGWVKNIIYYMIFLSVVNKNLKGVKTNVISGISWS